MLQLRTGPLYKGHKQVGTGIGCALRLSHSVSLRMPADTVHDQQAAHKWATAEFAAKRLTSVEASTMLATHGVILSDSAIRTHVKVHTAGESPAKAGIQPIMPLAVGSVFAKGLVELCVSLRRQRCPVFKFMIIGAHTA